ncbi:MAG: motility associated factor glycosyltransferase family protein [Treponema sp.]|nr:motility associated factor glycosyltransferase family protein [Treponema sp.]
MNSIWNKNILLFKERFPQLAQLLGAHIELFNKYAGTPDEQNLYPFWKITQTKAGIPTAEESGLRLHSAYNPIKESQSVLSSAEKELSECEAIVFLGAGLGYTPAEAATTHPEKTIIWIEPDAEHFFSAMLLFSLEPFLKCQNPVLAISCTPEQTLMLINQHSILKSFFFSVKAHTVHNQIYFDTIRALIERNKNKEKINNATLAKFEKLWTSNCKKNSYLLGKLNGIKEYRNKFQGEKFLMLAAGPSLQEILPHLKKLKGKIKIVAVDTALKACLRAGTEPDFIILTDPQYWAYRHLAGLKSPSSILISEIAAYPAVFRFECKKILLCNSQVPMAHEYQKEDLGDLGAGGSVASSAWNFCAYCGAAEIYVSGLDLSFPNRQTHIKGSTFEENVHTSSNKISTSETASLPMLFSGNTCIAEDYNSHSVLTDQRMKMFAWWFESRLAEIPQINTFTLAPQGLAIPGIKPVSLQNFLSKF